MTTIRVTAAYRDEQRAPAGWTGADMDVTAEANEGESIYATFAPVVRGGIESGSYFRSVEEIVEYARERTGDENPRVKIF